MGTSLLWSMTSMISISSSFFRTVIVGNVLTQVMCTSFGVLALSLAYWFRDCDPLLSGAIRKYDQVRKWRLLQVPHLLSETLSAGITRIHRAVFSDFCCWRWCSSSYHFASILLKIKLGSPKSYRISYPIRWRKSLFRKSDCLKTERSAIFVSKRSDRKKAEFLLSNQS